MIDVDDAAVGPLLAAINKHVSEMPPEKYANAAGALIGAGVGLSIGMGMTEEGVRKLVAELIDAMMLVHQENGQVTQGGSA